MTSLERASFVWVRIPELGQVMQEELPEALGDLVLLLGQFAQLDHLPIVDSLGWAESYRAPKCIAVSLFGMRRILVTGMSGTGKSSALMELEKRGFDVVDTDRGGWCMWSDTEGGYVWREDRITELLGLDEGRTLYVSGTVSNQGRFYPRFDAVVLLHAPAEVLLRRIAARATNDYGKSIEERDLIRRHVDEVEPLLRATCTHEIDATQPLGVVLERLVAIGEAA